MDGLGNERAIALYNCLLVSCSRLGILSPVLLLLLPGNNAKVSSFKFFLYLSFSFLSCSSVLLLIIFLLYLPPGPQCFFPSYPFTSFFVCPPFFFHLFSSSHHIYVLLLCFLNK